MMTTELLLPCKLLKFNVLGIVGILFLSFSGSLMARNGQRPTAKEIANPTERNLSSSQAPERRDSKITNLVHGGAGCEQGAVGVLLAHDAESLTIIFDRFDALSEGQGKVQSQCIASFEIESTPGFQYAILTAQIRGYASVSGSADAAYEMGLVPNDRKRNKTWNPKPKWGKANKIKTGFEGDFSEINEFRTRMLPWSGCEKSKGTLSIQTALLANGRGNGSAYISLDSLDAALDQSLEIVWRPCDPAKREKFSSICKLSVNKKNGKEKQFTAVGSASNYQDAVIKARSKIATKCANRGFEGNSCDGAAAVCSPIIL